MKKIILLLLLLVNITVGFTQKQNITFNHLSTDDGLSHFTASDLYIDEYGALWVGTREGVNRYNGNGITTYKLEKNNPNSLFCNNVFRITGDKNGNIYMLSSEGVAVFDLTTDKFTTLIHDVVTSIYYDDALYISKREKVYTFNEDTQTFELYYHLQRDNISILTIHIDDEANLWMGTDNEGVYKLEQGDRLTHPIKTGYALSIYEDSAANLWISSLKRGLYCIDKSGNIRNWRHDSQDPYSLSSNYVRGCHEDDFGNIWVGTFNGLNYYQKSTGRFETYEANGKEGSLSHSSIYSIVKDLQGTLWLGTYFGGVNYFNPEYEIYTHYKVSDKKSEGLSSNIVGRMSEDRHGNLWICTEGAGVNVYNREKKTFQWYRHDQSGGNSISHNNVKAIYHDNDGDAVWIGTHLGGLNRLDLKTNIFTHYRMKEGDDTTLPSDIIRDIIPYGNKLIIGTQNGVSLFNPKTGRCRQLFEDIELGDRIVQVVDLFIDKDNRLWIAVVGDGVFLYDFDTKKLTNYQQNQDDPNSLSSNSINNIVQDRQGNIWLATSGSGLDVYREETADFENFDMQKNDLSCDCIYKICESYIDENHLLLITNQGFSKFDINNKIFSNYSAENGFPLTAINENAMCVTRDGEVFLGGVDGMLSFYEKNLKFKSKPYNIILSRLTVNGKDITPDDETAILSSSLSHTSEITLQANQNMFSIEYATSNYILANRDNILYRLKGFSDEWNTMQRKQEIITYTNLNPGTYTLTLKAQREGVKEAKIIINVLPYWYNTWWAYLIYTISLMSLLLYLIYAYTLRIKLQESLKYEKKYTENIKVLNQSKLNFFTNISHEFRTNLTLIVGHIEMLMHVQNYTPTVYNKILSIYKSSLQLRGLITELLDFQKQEQGHMKVKASKHNIVDFLYENYLIFKEYVCSKQVNFNFINQEDVIEVWYDHKQMQKVINNLLSNALKYTKAGDTISINVKRDNDNVIVEVADTGSGINTSEINKIFDCFYQTERVDSLTSNIGTGIGLALTKGIVESNYGTIYVESEVGKGSSFIITLKLGNKHFLKEEISLNDEVIIRQVELPIPETVAIMKETALNNNDTSLHPLDTKMLIVEDNASVREMLSEIFSPFYQVFTASDGVEGLEIVHKEMPSIVVSDVVMPRMSGTELCKRIKGDFNICHIQVVLLTARTSVENTVEGLRFGADDYITKPFDVNILVSRCNNLVNSCAQLKEKFSKQPETFVQMLATNQMDKDLLDSAMAVIERYLLDPKFNVNIFASEMGLGRTALFLKLKALTGQTPNDFIMTIRLKKGAILLRNNPTLNIDQISEQIGFSSSRYFGKCFRKLYNTTPMAYRKGE